MKIVVLIGAVIWYLWRVYTLSYSPHEFPDPAFANKVWDRRSDYSAFLGAVVVAAAVYVSGISHHWWVVLPVFVVSIFLVALLQVGLVSLIIYGRAAKIILRIKMGFGPGAPWLAPFVWSYYITPEEKQRARQG